MNQKSKEKLNHISEISSWQSFFMPSTYLSLVIDNTKTNKGTVMPITEAITNRLNGSQKPEKTTHQNPIRVEDNNKQSPSI